MPIPEYFDLPIPGKKKLERVSRTQLEKQLPSMSLQDIQYLRAVLPRTEEVQGMLSPYDHRALAREYIGEGSPGQVVTGLGYTGFAPVYQAYKRSPLYDSPMMGEFGRTPQSSPPDIKQMWQTYLGALEGVMNRIIPGAQ